MNSFGMSGTAQSPQRLVVFRTTVLVADEEGDGCAEGAPLEESTEPFHLVGFLACGGAAGDVCALGGIALATAEKPAGDEFCVE